MKKGSRWRSVICFFHCQDELLIWGFETIKHWTNSARTRTRCTVLHLMMFTHKQGLILVDHHLPTICEKTGKDVELFLRINLAMQHSLLQFGFFQSEENSWGQRTWISLPPRVKQLISLSCRYSKNFWRNSHAHVILTSEADSLPTDTRQLLEDYGLVGCHSARSHDLSVHAKIDSAGYVRFLWASIGWANEFSFCSRFWRVKVRQKPERALADLREQTVDTLFSDLGTVALVIEGSDLSMTEDKFCA